MTTTLHPTITPALAAPSLRRRMACGLYESLLLFGVVFVAGLAIGFIGILAGTSVPPQVLQAALFIVLGGYFAWFWSRGQTLAMKTWRITVLDQHGRSLTPIRALTRYALSWIWLLPPLGISAHLQLPLAEIAVLTAGWIAIWCILSRFHPQRQFLHDALAGTRLVSTSSTSP